MGNIVPELMVRLGNIMIRPIVLFACQIWGVNLMGIKKGLNAAGTGVEHIHISSQVLVGSAPLKPYGFDKGCKHTYINMNFLRYIH